MAKKLDPYFIVQNRTYLNRDGRICDRNDKRRASLLSPAGGKIPMQRAIELGLANADGTLANAPPSDNSSTPENLTNETGNPGGDDDATEALALENGEPVDEVDADTKRIDAPPSDKAIKRPPDTKYKLKK